MASKGQMNPTSRVSIMASQAGENSQTNGSEHTIVSSILTDLIFKRRNGRRAFSDLPLKLMIEPAKQPSSTLFVQQVSNSKLTQIST